MAILNPLDKYTSVVLTSDNLTYSTPASTAVRTDKIIKGKIYVEFLANTGYNSVFGFTTKDTPLNGNIWTNTDAVTYSGDGYARVNTTQSSLIKAISNGDIFSIAVDTENLTFSYYINGISIYTSTYKNPNNKDLYFMVGAHTGLSTGSIVTSNFNYPAPSGYLPYGVLNKTLILHDGEYKKHLPAVVSEYILQVDKPVVSETSPYTITTSSVYDSRDAVKGYRAFAYADANGWLSLDNKSAINGQWLNIDLKEKTKVNSFSLYSNTNGYTQAMPTNFIIQGSDDGIIFKDIKEYTTSWTAIDVVVEKFFDMPLSDYRHYRLYVKAVGAYSYVSICYLKYYLKTEDFPARIEVVSSTLPTSQQFLSDGMDSLSPLLDRRVETLEPLPMTDKSEILSGDEVGKMFNKTIDLKKYLDIRNIKVEVR